MHDLGRVRRDTLESDKKLLQDLELETDWTRVSRRGERAQLMHSLGRVRYTSDSDQKTPQDLGLETDELEHWAEYRVRIVNSFQSEYGRV